MATACSAAKSSIAELSEAGGKRKRSRWPRRKASDVDTESETDELKIVDDKAADRATASRSLRDGVGDAADAVGAGATGSASDRRERRDRPSPDDEETEEITGILEITRQRHGFLSVEGSDDDIYVSASQVRRCELKEGDEVTGPARAPRRGERHRALVRVNLVNGEPPVEAPAQKKRDGGRTKQARPAASSTAVEVSLVSIDGEQAVVEIQGRKHTLKPGDRLAVSIGSGEDA